MDEQKKLRAMRSAIRQATLSLAEDDRLHPKVGAVLTDKDGEILLISSRGRDGRGGHAEYKLLSEAELLSLDLTDTSLFVTLEPCTRRSEKKVPCAVRIARSGIKSVYIGTLDPNPHIIGRGSSYLSTQNISVEQFPLSLQQELHLMNAAFEASHSFLSEPVIAAEINGRDLPRQRSGILTTTLDLVASASGMVRIYSGDTTWLGSIYIGILEAKLREVEVRLLAQKQLPPDILQSLKHLGVEVGIPPNDLRVRGTITGGVNNTKSLLLVERRPANHALIYSRPHEESVLTTFCAQFEHAWAESEILPSETPELRAIPFEQVKEALLNNVPAYRFAEITEELVEVSHIKLLTNDVEVLKLRRVASLERITQLRAFQGCFHVVGTPWTLSPPIVERQDDGTIVLIDGSHRVYHARQRKAERVNAIVVSQVTMPLPSQPLSSGNAVILPEKRSRDVRYKNYVDRYFRPLKAALQAGVWHSALPSLTSAD